MANLIITYDLRNQRDYKTLIDAIKSYGTYAKLFESSNNDFATMRALNKISDLWSN